MERLVIIVDQLEEAKRLLVGGTLSHLRMALLLLDNASEILMYQAVMTELSMHDLCSRLYSSAERAMPSDQLEKLRSELNYKPLTTKARKTLVREYDAKADFLVSLGRQPGLSAPVAGVLKATHRYRNAAYHRDQVRAGTLQPVVIVLFDIVVDLLTDLPPSIVSYSSQDDWSGFWGRYGMKYELGVYEKGVLRIVQTLKDGMDVNASAIAHSLADHLESRVDDMTQSLAFIAENSGSALSPAEELERVQFCATFGYMPRSRQDTLFKLFKAPLSYDRLGQWHTEADGLRSVTDKLALFGHFVQIESEIEPIEEKVFEAEADLDSAIQAAIDIARGK